MNQPIRSSVSSMIQQSIHVFTRPSVATFERYERAGGLPQAVTYVLLAAVITGLLTAAQFGVLAWFAQVLVSLAGFLVFTGVVYAFGRTQGGTGTLDEVAYTFALFWAPISVVVIVLGFVFGILKIILIGYLLLALLSLARMLVSVFFAYLAVQSSMNMRDPVRIVITLVLAAAASWAAQAILYLIL